MRCENCGAELADGTRFCTSCGAEVSTNAAQETVVEQQQADYNQQYHQPPQQQYYPQPVMDPPLSVGQYIGILLLMIIPVVNLLFLLIWAFGSTNRNRKNFARAALIMAIIGIAITVILMIILGPAFFAWWGGGPHWRGSWWGGMTF